MADVEPGRYSGGARSVRVVARLGPYRPIFLDRSIFKLRPI